MGPSYSVGPFPVFLEGFIRALDTTKLRSLRYYCEKTVTKSAYLSCHDVMLALNLSTEDTYKLCRLLDRDSKTFVNASELWNALALAGPSEQSEKVHFCFETFDYRKVKRLSPQDIVVLLVCSTRGLANLKDISPPPMEMIEDFVYAMCRNKRIHFDDNGDISLIDFKSYMLSNDQSRSYLSSLGTVAVSIDKVKLVSQRGDIMKRLSDLDAEIKFLQMKVDHDREDSAMYLSERGGDSRLFKLIELDTSSSTSSSAPNAQTRASSRAVSSYVSEDGLISSSLLTSSYLENKYIDVGGRGSRDARAFKSNESRPDRNSRDDANEAMKNVAWKNLSTDDDELATVTPNIVFDVLESANLTANIEDCSLCLEAVPRNQLGRISLGSILDWYNHYQVLKSRSQSDWDNFTSFLSDRCKDFHRAFLTFARSLNTLSAVKCADHASTKSAYSVRNKNHFSLWQRQRLYLPSSKLQLNFVVPSKKPQSTHNVAAAAAVAAIAAITSHKNIATSSPEGVSLEFVAQSTLLSGSTLSPDYKLHSLNSIDQINSSVLLNSYSYLNDKGFSEYFASVCWVVFQTKKSASPREVQIFSDALKGFLVSIRCKFHDFYDEVKTETLKLKLSVEDDTEVCVVVVSLLCKEDLYKQCESCIPETLFVSRALRNLSLKLEIDQSASEVFDLSSKYLDFDRRLYGPQEEELSEDEKNPIKFAKLCKQKKLDALNSLERCIKMSLSELMSVCRAHGLSADGDAEALIARCKDIFAAKAKLVGYGELSSFGLEQIRSIFNLNRLGKKGGMSFWDMNRLLYHLGSETIFDSKDFDGLMLELSLLRDEENNLTFEGFRSYYEKYGRLANDITSLGFGSLNEILSGKFSLLVDFDAEALGSFNGILEPSSVAFQRISRLVLLLSSSDEVLLDDHFDSFGEILTFLMSLLGLNRSDSFADFFKGPGSFAKFALGLYDYFAFGESGVLFALRNKLQHQLGKYYEWDEIFTNLLISQEKFADESNVENEFSERLAEILPEILDIGDSVRNLLSMENQMRFLQDCLFDGALRLSRADASSVQEVIVKIRSELRILHDTVDKVDELLPAHVCASYDAMRLYCDSISMMGFGTNEFTSHVGCTGINISAFLPLGKGEKSMYHETQIRKEEMANQRKDAAMAALRRARTRRNDSDAERKQATRVVIAPIESKVDTMELEISDLFNELSYQYLSCKGKPSQKGRASIVQQWEVLIAKVETKYPNSVKHAIALNNRACAIARYLDKNHVKQPQKIAALQLSLSILWHVIAGKTFDEVADPNAPFGDHFEFALLENIERAAMWPFAAVLINYALAIKSIGDKISMHLANFVEVLLDKVDYVDSMFDSCIFTNIPVFAYTDSFRDIYAVLTDICDTGSHVGESADESTAASTKFSKKSNKTHASSDPSLKLAAIRKRNELYELIQSGEITTLFETASKGDDASKAIAKYL